MDANLKGKNIVLGVTGGIAAYKSCELVRMFVKDGADVHVILTKAGSQFVTPLTLQTLSKNPVHQEMFETLSPEGRGSSLEHISLADRANVLVVAPATANIIAKVAHGICDDLLSTVICATKAPVVFAPAMNVNMWENKITQRNLGLLKDLGYRFVEPETGELACGYEGTGRMASSETIFEFIALL